MSAPISRREMAVLLIQKMMVATWIRASRRCYGVYEYVGIFCKHPERTQRQISVIPG